MLLKTILLLPILLIIISLLVGSFLNVVVHRLPNILKQQWREEAASIIDDDRSANDSMPFTRYNLAFPYSHCPNCHTLLHIWHNIPLFSYLALRGRCAFCKTRIHWRYPLLEGLCLILSALVIWHFGIGWQTGAALLFTWLLLAMSFIDLEHQLLPDSLTYILLWLGLFVNLFDLFIPLSDAVIGALVGYLSLWSIMWLFKLISGRQGMGHGDFKLFAALGAWLGWKILPHTILLAALAGAIIGIIILSKQGKNARHTPLPFGPYLAVSGWIMLLYGQYLINYWY